MSGVSVITLGQPNILELPEDNFLVINVFGQGIGSPAAPKSWEPRRMLMTNNDGIKEKVVINMKYMSTWNHDRGELTATYSTLDPHKRAGLK